MSGTKWTIEKRDGSTLQIDGEITSRGDGSLWVLTKTRPADPMGVLLVLAPGQWRAVYPVDGQPDWQTEARIREAAPPPRTLAQPADIPHDPLFDRRAVVDAKLATLRPKETP